jgi:hypothetical protein
VPAQRPNPPDRPPVGARRASERLYLRRPRPASLRHEKTVKALKKSAADHRDTVKSLKADLKKVRKMRKTVSSTL